MQANDVEKGKKRVEIIYDPDLNIDIQEFNSSIVMDVEAKEETHESFDEADDMIFEDVIKEDSQASEIEPGDVVFPCDQCGKKLASKKRLVQHIQQTHSKQVICEICNRKIANPAQLKRHKVFTHKKTEGAWFCQKCPKSVFFSKSTYELHLKDKH